MRGLTQIGCRYRPVILSLTFLIGVLPMTARAESRYFVTSDGVKLHYTVNGEGAPMVLVPGWTMPAWIFAPQIEYFSASHRVIAFDPRSQGESAVARTGHEPRRRARDIAELIKKEKLKDVVLVGWSLGVLDSLAYTRYHGTTKLAALVLIDSSAGVGPRPKSGTFMDDLRNDREGTVDYFVRAMFNQLQDEDYYRALIESSLRTPLAASIKLLSYPRKREFWRDALFAVDKPVFYAVTAPYVEHAAIVRQEAKHAQAEVFESAGHALFVDEPDRFNLAVERFLEALPAAQR